MVTVGEHVFFQADGCEVDSVLKHPFRVSGESFRLRADYISIIWLTLLITCFNNEERMEKKHERLVGLNLKKPSKITEAPNPQFSQCVL